MAHRLRAARAIYEGISSRPIGPRWFPLLFITVACDAISGFHGLVASGTSCKQLDKETDARYVGYGGAIGEGSLALTSIIATTAGFAASAGIDRWHEHYGTWARASAGATTAFVNGIGILAEGIGIPHAVAAIFAAVVIISFASTTMDTGVRLQRYIVSVSELGAHYGVGFAQNRWIATLIAVVSCAILALGIRCSLPPAGSARYVDASQARSIPMNTRRAVVVALTASLLTPLAARGQTDQAGELASVATWEVEPSQFGAFLSIAAKVVQAANQAKLGQAYSWTMWHNFYTVTLVGPFNRKELDDPDDWMKQFTGTPGEATLMEAFQEMERTGVQIRNSVNEIHQGVPAWTYEPAGMGQPPLAWVHVMEFWLKSGQQNEQDWNTLMGDFKAFFKEIGYPYPIWGNRVRYGDQRAIFVTAYDDAGAYHGDKSVEALAANHNVAERWQSLIERVAQLTVRARDSHHEFLPTASYLGPAAPTGGQP